jgi:hypothetical protein
MGEIYSLSQTRGVADIRIREPVGENLNKTHNRPTQNLRISAPNPTPSLYLNELLLSKAHTKMLTDCEITRTDRNAN